MLGLNTERYSVFLRTGPNEGKYAPEKLRIRTFFHVGLSDTEKYLARSHISYAQTKSIESLIAMEFPKNLKAF